MEKSTKKVLFFVAFGVGLYVLLNNVSDFFGFFETLYKLMLPVVLGFIIAFVLNVPMSALRRFFNFLLRKMKKTLPQKAIDIVCVILVLALLAFLCWAVVMLAIPSLIETVGSVVLIIQEQIPKITQIFEENNIDPAILEQIVDFLHLDEDYNVGFNPSALISPVFTTVKSMLTAVINLIFALVVAIYAMLSKDELYNQMKRMGYSLFPARVARFFGHVCSLLVNTYSKFLSAQCIEATILGVLMFLAFTAFGIPYAGLVSVLTALFAFLPYIGAFGACFIGAFLTLVAAPSKVLLCIIVYTVVQFTENQFIYPHVVCNSVGLSPVWTLVAALVGGNLMGLFGMVFFIPLASVIYVLLGEFTEMRLRKKKLIIGDDEGFGESDSDLEQVNFEFDTSTAAPEEQDGALEAEPTVNSEIKK